MLGAKALSNFDGIEDCFAVLVITSGNRLEEINSDVVKKVMNRDRTCIYVSINQPYVRMVKILRNNNVNVNKIFFIDCITETGGGKAERTGNCLFLNSPSNLTELGISISHAIEAIPSKKFLFIDALSTLTIYTSSKSFAKFAHFLMTKSKILGINGIFMVIGKEISEDIFSDIIQFADKVIRLN